LWIFSVEMNSNTIFGQFVNISPVIMSITSVVLVMAGTLYLPLATLETAYAATIYALFSRDKSQLALVAAIFTVVGLVGTAYAWSVEVYPPLTTVPWIQVTAAGIPTAVVISTVTCVVCCCNPGGATAAEFALFLTIASFLIGTAVVSPISHPPLSRAGITILIILFASCHVVFVLISSQRLPISDRLPPATAIRPAVTGQVTGGASETIYPDQAVSPPPLIPPLPPPPLASLSSVPLHQTQSDQGHEASPLLDGLPAGSNRNRSRPQSTTQNPTPTQTPNSAHVAMLGELSNAWASVDAPPPYTPFSV
jgi:hypothetical protein